MTDQHLEKIESIRFKHESASATLHIFEGDKQNLCILANVWAGVRGEGHGRGLMEKVVRYADAHNLLTLLHVRRYGTGRTLDNAQLEEFYSKFGFERVPDGNKPVLMHRKPKENQE